MKRTQISDSHARLATKACRIRSPRLVAMLLLVPAGAVGLIPAAQAELYAGGGIGRANVELGSFDESDSATKLIVGYIFDLPAVDFSVEGNYVDFGKPENGGDELDVKGFDAFAVAGIDFGLVGIFAKAGVIAWDADATSGGFTDGTDGTDPAYGIGVRFNLASLDIRTEYEKFEIETADDLDLLSASIVWRF